MDPAEYYDDAQDVEDLPAAEREVPRTGSATVAAATTGVPGGIDTLVANTMERVLVGALTQAVSSEMRNLMVSKLNDRSGKQQ